MHTRVLLVVVVLIAGAVAPVAAGAQTGGQTTDASESNETTCSFPQTVTDGTGTEVTLDDEPETVVTLNPSIAQILWEIDAEERVVGTTKHAANLDGADERTSISTDSKAIDAERVVDLDADIVLATSADFVTEETIEALREAGQTVYYLPAAESIDDVRDQIRTVGSLVGECDAAADTVDWMDEELASVDAAIEGEGHPDVLYTFFGYTAGSDTFVHELIEAGGGRNVAADAGVSGYAQVDGEMVVETDPEWIVTNTNSPEVPDTPAFQSTTAVQNDRVLTVNVNHLNRPGPRIVHAVTAFAEAFHPDAYENASAENAAAEGNASQSTTDDGSDGSAGEDPVFEAVPGFGAVAAVAGVGALLAIASVGARRRRFD